MHGGPPSLIIKSTRGAPCFTSVDISSTPLSVNEILVIGHLLVEGIQKTC
jgi:hypothetical protein